MKRSSMVMIWTIVLALGWALFLGMVAADRERRSVLAELEHASANSAPASPAMGVLAAAVLHRQMTSGGDDRDLINAAATVLLRCPSATALRKRLGDGIGHDIDRQLARTRPDSHVLRLDLDLLAVIGDGRREGYRDRVVRDMVRARELEATCLRLANRLRIQGDEPGGDADLAELATARAALRIAVGDDDGLEAADPQTPKAMDASASAAIGRLGNLLDSLSAGSAGVPPNLAMVDRVRWTWHRLMAMGLDGRCRQSLISRYVKLTRSTTIPRSALLLMAVIALGLILGIAIASHRLARGPEPIDPSAETLENVEPIDLDTDAETMEAKHRPTGVETRPG